MTNKIAIAALVPLILGAAGAFGGELHFQTPMTDRAKEMRPLLSRAAYAVHDRMSGTAGDPISDLWIFPTADNHTVFVQYVVTSNETSPYLAAPQVHVELLEVQSDQVVEELDLSSTADNSALGAQQVGAERDWSASIGNGHTTDSRTQTSALAIGSPAAAHWSALIGSGQISDESAQRARVTSKETASPTAHAHWTAKIGTARATDSSTNPRNGRSAS